MGLTNDSTGRGSLSGDQQIHRRKEGDRVIALAGNPNVGKSTLFNECTGLRQHTGNWPGKTVATAQGVCTAGGKDWILVDLPGCYSLLALSPEEEVARNFLQSGQADAVIVVCDATCLERNLNLVLQTLEITPHVVLCLNLIDEAARRRIVVDVPLLSQELGIPVVSTVARNGKGVEELFQAVEKVLQKPTAATNAGTAHPTPLRLTDNAGQDFVVRQQVLRAERIAGRVVRKEAGTGDRRDRRLDRLLTSRWTGFPIMLALLATIFWITITGANIPSQWLSNGLFWIEERLLELAEFLHSPTWLSEMLIHGMYRVLAWVVSVMLPPMAIFFPLFTLLEDLGYLPRIAFNLDKCFKKCCACGKQALTMCMGFGCNAAGVVGCRIIDSPRERLIAMLTNNLVPCNGRFPILISLLTMFFLGGMAGPLQSVAAALLLALLILLGIAMTFFLSWLLSKTILRGLPSSFILELPPYRKPQIGKVLLRSLLDRTLFVLGRAVAIAAPAGLLIWILANVSVSGSSLLAHCSNFLDPLGRFLGMDGVILFAFFLGLPANEIVIPLIVLSYMAEGHLIEMSLPALQNLLLANGWSETTAICTMLFTLFHWPCSTTLLTIRKETQSTKWMLVAFLLPTLLGMILCGSVAALSRLWG